MEEQEVREACRSTILRSVRACIEAGAGNFKYKLKKTVHTTDE